MPVLDVDGTRLNYVDIGPGAATLPSAVPLVLLHAFPLHSGMWAPQLACLSSSRRVIAPDLTGFGDSDAPDDIDRYTMSGLAGDLARLLDRLGVDRIVLGGLSMGGYVAFAFLRTYAERVAGLILADTRATPDTAQVIEQRTSQQDQVSRQGAPALVEVLLAGLLCEHTRSHRPELVAQVRRLMANPDAGYIGALEAMKRRPDATGELAAVRVPALVVVGEHDALTPPDVATAMHRAIPHARLAVLPNAGHLSNLEAPDEFNAAVADFLELI